MCMHVYIVVCVGVYGCVYCSVCECGCVYCSVCVSVHMGVYIVVCV